MPDARAALTDKEKETLRLIVRGHDAKSIARLLDLSVHTINNRLRDARRKLAVSSSREAARLLFEQEEAAPENAGHKGFGDATEPENADVVAPPQDGRGRRLRFVRALTGVATMLIALTALAIALSPQPATDAPRETADVAMTAEVEGAARRWLALLDRGDWNGSYAATAASFRQLNTPEVWAAVSERARTPLGATISRTLLSQEDVPAPPHGYQVVKYRTSFANKSDAVEIVSLDRENGVWRVVGIYIS